MRMQNDKYTSAHKYMYTKYMCVCVWECPGKWPSRQMQQLQPIGNANGYSSLSIPLSLTLCFCFAADVDGRVRGGRGLCHLWHVPLPQDTWHRLMHIYGKTCYIFHRTFSGAESRGESEREEKPKEKWNCNLPETEIFKCCSGHKSTYCQLFSNAPTVFHNIYIV